MRSIKLTAVSATAASLTLVCAVASAHGGHRQGRHEHREAGATAGECHVTLDLAPRLVYAGESVSVFGRLSCKGGGEEKQTVTVYQRTATASAYTVAATGTTEAHGAYLVNVAGMTTNSLFYVVAGPATSGHRQVRVVALVKLAGPPEGVLQTVRPSRSHPLTQTFAGEVSPADKGATVILQRQNAIKGNGWHRIGSRGVVGEGGKFTIEHSFVVPGPANIRVVVRDPGVNVGSPSNVLTYEIAQAQNPSLKIESSADPISYGQSMTIHGSVEKLIAGTPLRLMARPAHTNAYTAVSETKVQPGGTYAFASQTPLASTFYKVLGGGESSAVMYEGVKYLLTARISPSTTVEQGEAVSFSGTVKPGIAGHVIYLERENAGGTGFHVIDVGRIVEPKAPQTEYTYSIEHKFYALGTEVVRIKIPGDPQNGTTVSEPFTIQVNPAPAAALTQEPPGNINLPSEGEV